jgi:hypothetical protein
MKYTNEESKQYKALKTKISLSKTALTSSVLTVEFSSFIACFVYSKWHSISFHTIAISKMKKLLATKKFVHDVLKSTALPFSVVLVSLYYIDQLKIRRPRLAGGVGSECRVFVCALMLAMKTLCDNTYSNKSWEKVSGIPLLELNKSEVRVNFVLKS